VEGGRGCDALVLALVDVVAGPSAVVGGRRDRVQVLHHALQVLHLVVKLLCAVGRLQALGEAITWTVLGMEDVRRPDLGHGWHGGEVHPAGVDGGGGVGAGGARQEISFKWTRRLGPYENSLWL